MTTPKQAEMAALVAALKPFAHVGDITLLTQRRDERGEHWLSTGSYAALNISDFRHARDVLAALSSEPVAGEATTRNSRLVRDTFDADILADAVKAASKMPPEIAKRRLGATPVPVDAGGALQWADNSDPVGELAIKLAARANAREEEDGEWTWRDIAAAALSPASPTPGGDMVLVPVEPTEAMLDEGCGVSIAVYPTNIPSGWTALNHDEAREIWSAMLTAFRLSGREKGDA